MMVLFSCFLVAVGICLGSVMQEVEAFQLVMSILVMPLFFLSDALFPLDKMPSWLQAVSLMNPITYAADGLRGLLIGAGHFSIFLDFGVVIASLLVALAVSTYLFSKTSI